MAEHSPKVFWRADLSDYTVNLKVSETAECHQCGEVGSIHELRCTSCDALTLYIDFADLLQRQHKGQIMDARFGGLVLGRDTTVDDIVMLCMWPGNVACVTGLMQGGEYILSPEATELHRDQIEEINSEKGDPSEIEGSWLTTTTHTLDTRLGAPFLPFSNFGALLVAPGQFVINRFATKKHFKRLCELNSCSRQFG